MSDQQCDIYTRSSSGILQKLKTKNFLSFQVQNAQKSSSQRDDENCEVKTFPAGSSVPSLYDQCMELLSQFTHCFESLEDFPEDFGREIFNKALDKLLIDNENVVKSLETFTRAYPDQFLSSCHLNKSLRLINNYELGLPALISHVVSLEISDSDVDDDHDIIDTILNLHLLENLSLSGNSLTDKGIRRLVLPLLGKKRRSQIKYLDVSFNKLDEKAVKRIKLIPGLETLIVGQDDVKDDSILSPQFEKRSCPRIFKISNIGFGSVLLDKWREELEINLKQKKLRETETNFYKKREICDNFKTDLKNSNVRNKIMFCKARINPLQSRDEMLKKRKIESIENVPKKPRLDITVSKTVTDIPENSFDKTLLEMYSN